MQARALFGLATLALASAVRDARPCSIVIAPQVFPASHPAPVNAHVWIRHPPLKRTGNVLFRKGPTTTYDADFVLRAVSPVAAEIPIATREWCPSIFVELVPQSALPPSSRFEVWIVPRVPEVKPVLIASFGTGTAPDTTPPPRPTFTGAMHEVEGGGLAGCGTIDVIALTGGTDSPELLYAMWSADANGLIAWDAPPVGLFTEPRFDGYGTCRADYASWSAKAPRIGIRAMDVAGNLGAPIELTVANK